MARNVPTRFTRSTKRKSSSSTSPSGRRSSPWKTPALVMTPSSPPNASTAAATAVLTSSSFPTSAGAASAVPPASVISRVTSRAASAARSTTVTDAPSRASRCAAARPMPLAPPVTRMLPAIGRARYPATLPRVSEPALVGLLRISQLACRGMGSPFSAALLERMADDVTAGGPIGRFLSDQLESTYEDAVPLRFLGGVHRLVLSGSVPELAARFPSVGGGGDAAAAWAAVLSALRAHEDASPGAPTRPPPTQEAGRAAAPARRLPLVAPAT